MAMIDSAYEKKDLEMISHILDKLPKEFSELVTMVEAMPSLTLKNLKAKIRVFFIRKFKNEKSDGELALAAFGTKFNGLCRSCGKQGHKAADCRVKNKTQGDGNRPPPKGFNCNKHAGHVAKDCPEPKQERTTTKETGILPDTEVGVFRLYQPSTYDYFYTRVYGETESRISLDVMLDVESEHHIISMSLTPRRYAGIVAGTTMIHVSPVYIRYVLRLK